MILAIESSCDESAIALLDPKVGFYGEWIHSQIELHSEYGGVVPDLATREHLTHFPNLLRSAKKKLANSIPTAIAVTQGPGLAGCLAMGISTAKSLAGYYKIPLIPINHLQAHAFSPFISCFEKNPPHFEDSFSNYFPHLGLVISGGNTLLFEITKNLQITILAETVDDAAGEAIDKGAKLLGLPYPGGPQMEKLSQDGNPREYSFPRAFSSPQDMKFSFSGLKTSLRYLIEKMDDDQVNSSINSICASYQKAVVDQIIRKTKQVLITKNYSSIGLSGGVANNTLLRESLTNLGKNSRTPVYLAKKSHTGDNAGMIAFAAYLANLKKGCELKNSETMEISFKPNWRLS